MFVLIFTSVSCYFVFQYYYYPIVVFPGANMYLALISISRHLLLRIYWLMHLEILYLGVYQVAIFSCYVCFSPLFWVGGRCMNRGNIYFIPAWYSLKRSAICPLEMSQNLNQCPFEMRNVEKSITLFTLIELWKNLQETELVSMAEISRAKTFRRQSTFVRVHTSSPLARNHFLVWVVSSYIVLTRYWFP